VLSDFVFEVTRHFSLEQYVTFCCSILSPAIKGEYLDLQPSATKRIFLSIGSFYLLPAPMPLY